jgi:L-fucose mutarotase
MLKYRLTHPELLAAIAGMGHGSQIMLADSNYSVDINSHPGAKRIYLNLAPGMIAITDVLAVLLDAMPVEAAHHMLMDDGQAPPIAEEFRRMLPQQVPLEAYRRFDFYDAVKRPTTSVVVATGEQRLYANLILTMGVVQPDGKARY